MLLYKRTTASSFESVRSIHRNDKILINSILLICPTLKSADRRRVVSAYIDYPIQERDQKRKTEKW